MYDAVIIGRVGVDLYALDFNTRLKDVRRFSKYVGGGAANISVGLAKLGLNVAIISKVGNDDLGQFIIDYLKRESVDTRYLKKTSKGRTGIVFAETFPGRDGKFIFFRENVADLLITEKDVDNSAVNYTRTLVVTGTGLSANPSRDSSYRAMELVSRRRGVNVLNLDWRPSLWKGVSVGSRIQYYKKAIDLSDMIIGNEKEYLAATGVNDGNTGAARSRIAGREEKFLILTQGEKGSIAYSKGEVVKAPPFKVRSLKTLGAGDGNLAGIIYGYLKRWDVRRMLRFGNAIGAMVVTRHACSEAMPTYDEVMMFAKANGGL
ncbi:MAG: 5-dehydro-2-deoxygluconokinase [Nitrososphaerales archaeon]